MNRLAYFLIFMAVFSAIYQLGSMLDVSEEDAAIFIAEFEELVANIDGLGIFTHNTTIALPMFIPGFGLIWGFFSAFSTGYAIAAFATITPEIAAIPPLAILYATPFGIMELAAYSLGTSRSYMLVSYMIRKMPLRPQLAPTLIEIAAVLALLLAGGFIEYYMLSMNEFGVIDLPDG